MNTSNLPENFTGMMTDQYEITMLDTLIANNTHRSPAVFEAFTRKLPSGRKFGVVAGVERVISSIKKFTFSGEDVSWLREHANVSDATAEYLKHFRFTGTLRAYPEGTIYLPNSPVIQVEGELGQCLILETVILSILNHDTAVASAAARMYNAAGNRQTLVDFGTRRTHEDAALAAARAAYVAGFNGTSNLRAAANYGIPNVGTIAHAFILSQPTEEDAFRAHVQRHGVDTTLLVDTYNTREGINTAIKVAGAGLAAIRLDSGDLAEEIVAARRQLDALGAVNTRIVATSDLDEYSIKELSWLPVDGFGVGTRLVTGSGHPASGFVYKLVAVNDGAGYRPVAKSSEGKATVGGKKNPLRVYTSEGVFAGEHLDGSGFTEGEEETTNTRNVYYEYISEGNYHVLPTLSDIREVFFREMGSLPASMKEI